MTSTSIPRREQDGEIVFDGFLEATALQEFVDQLKAVAHEAKLHFDDEGLHASLIDPSGVAMETPTLRPEAWESFDAGQVLVGVSLDKLQDQIGMANKGELIRVRIDMESHNIKLEIGSRIKPTISLIEPDSIREEPDLPDLDLPNRAVVDPAELEEALDAVDLVSDHVKFAWDGDDEVFVVAGEGDTDDTRVEFALDPDDGFTGYELRDGSHFDSEEASLFEYDFLEDMVGAIPKQTEEVALRFGSDFPVILEYESQDGHLECEALCAPRIQSE